MLRTISDIVYRAISSLNFPTMFFYIFLYLIVRHLFKKIEESDRTKKIEVERYFRYDTLVATAVYLICTLLFFYPCLKDITNSLLGPLGDNVDHFWNIWWMHKVFSGQGLSLSYSNYIFYPEGTSLLYQAYSFFNLFLSLLLSKFFNAVAVYNILILATFPLAGISAFFLVRYLSKDSLAGIIGGYIFAFSPSHFCYSQYHIEVSSIYFIPLFILFLIKAIKYNLKRDIILTGLFFFLNTICNWYYMIYAIYFIIFSYLYLAIRRKEFFLKDVFTKSAVVIGVTLLIISPWLARMIIAGIKGAGLSYGGHDFYIVDGFMPLIPTPSHLLAQLQIVKTANSKFIVPNTAYLGLIYIIIVGITIKEIIKKTAKYLLGLMAFFILSMGVSINLLGWKTPIYLPYTLIRYIPFVSNARCPIRIMPFVYLFFAIIVAFALKELFSYSSVAKRRFILAPSILLLFLDYYSLCTSMTRVYIPPCYSAIKKQDATFGILDLPLQFDLAARRRFHTIYPDIPIIDRPVLDYYTVEYMMYQTFHEFPIVEGYIARKAGYSLLNYLDIEDLVRQKEQLTKNRVKYVVIHKKNISEIYMVDIPQYEKYYKKIYEDKDNIVLEVY